MPPRISDDFGGKAITLPYEDAEAMFAAFLDAVDEAMRSDEERPTWRAARDYEIIRSHGEAFGLTAAQVEEYNPYND